MQREIYERRRIGIQKRDGTSNSKEAGFRAMIWVSTSVIALLWENEVILMLFSVLFPAGFGTAPEDWVVT